MGAHMRSSTESPAAWPRAAVSILASFLGLLSQAGCTVEKSNGGNGDAAAMPTTETLATEFMASYIRTTLAISETCGAEIDAEEITEQWLAGQLRICDMSVWEAGYDGDAAESCLSAFEAVPPRVVQGEIQCPRHQTAVPECRSMREVWMEACYPDDPIVARRYVVAGSRSSAEDCAAYSQDEFFRDYIETSWASTLACISDIDLDETVRRSYSYQLDMCPLEVWSWVYEPCVAQQGIDRTIERMLVWVVEPEYCDDDGYGGYYGGDYQEMQLEWSRACEPLEY